MSKDYNLNSITFDGIADAIILNQSIGLPSIFLGTYGIGKSAGVQQACEALGFTMVDFRASEILPEDVGGIGVPVTPADAEMYVKRAVPDLVQSCRDANAQTGKPVMLFLDEITSALPSVQAALFQVLLDNRAGGCDLPPDTYVVAAGNLATDRSVVEELARPLLNRAAVYNYTGPTFEEYQTYMTANDFHPIIQTFLKVTPAYVCDKIDPNNEQSPTPRSLHRASDALNSPKMRKSRRMTHMAAMLGGECAAALEAYITVSDGLTPFSTIMSDPEGVDMPSEDDFAIGYMQSLAVAQGLNRMLAEDVNAMEGKATSTLWKYVKRLPPELGSLVITSFQSPAVTALLSNHLSELESARGGVYGRIISQLV